MDSNSQEMQIPATRKQEDMYKKPHILTCNLSLPVHLEAAYKLTLIIPHTSQFDMENMDFLKKKSNMSGSQYNFRCFQCTRR